MSFCMRSRYAGKSFVRAYPRERQERFLDGHIRAFDWYGGVFPTVVFDNLKTAVRRILRGKARIEQDRFTALRAHYTFEARFCNPARGQEKGGVEGLVGFARAVMLIWMAEPLDLSTDLYDKAINSVAGRLTEALLREMESKRQQGSAATDLQRQLVQRIAGHEGPAGQLGRAVLTHEASFLLSIDRNCVIDILGPRISASDREGAALRAVMLDGEAVSPKITRLLGKAVQQGVIESDQSGHAAARVASQVLRAAVAEVRGDDSGCWGLTASDVADILREARPNIRSGALAVLADWIQSDDEAVENKWSLEFRPFFEKVWPKEHHFRDVSLTAHWIALAVGAGTEFPAALEQLQPYIAPYRGHGSLYSIASSKAPKKFPRETLSLIWLVCGPNSSGSFYEISKIINRLIKADPDIEVDRRLQSLEQRAERYD